MCVGAQVALWLAPHELVGRELRVLWPDDDGWFCGRVTHHDVATGSHKVSRVSVDRIYM